MPDPTTLTDEELDAQINNTEPDKTPEPEKPEPDKESPNPTEDEPQPDEPAPEPDEPDKPEPQHISRRESLRIKQLLDNLKQNQQPQTTPKSQRTDALDYATELDADPETIKRLQEDRQKAEEARYREGLAQSQAIEWRTLLQIDAPQVETKYPQLNKNDAENFHPAVADSLNTWYLQMSGWDSETRTASNPAMRYSDFVEGIYELAEEIASTRSASTQKNVAEQARNTAIRPDGSTSSKRLNLNQDPGSMTDAELDAAIALGIPKR